MAAALAAGVKLGPYEILAPIGAGGMGEVWKARDTRLDRTVALKISKTEFSQRFEREARAIATLNHPNVCHLYDVGPDYLVMEYIEGQPLKGPLTAAKAIEHGSQILDALDAAHRKGITHRDLKPANILLTRNGVKVLDFGLAKMESQTLGHDAPTALTANGSIAGTLYYMAPEQLQGASDVDSRADIFAFGCVLYEMLTGRRAFDGSNAASVIAAVMERPAPSVSDVAPPALDAVLKRCLEKDRDERWQTARDLKWELRRSMESVANAAARVQAGPVWWMAAAAGATLIAAALSFIHFRQPGPEPPLVRSEITPPEGNSVRRFTPPALSPDGRTLAFAARSADGKARLWLRRLDSPSAQPLPGTEDSTFPFWSPDGKSIGFFAESKLKRVDLAGGPPLTLANVPNARGGTWGADGTILFAGATGPLLRVLSSGGPARPVTRLGGAKENSHRWPQFLPDGKHFLMAAIFNGVSHGSVRLGSIESPDTFFLMEADSGAVYSQGYLLFLRGNTLMAQPFDSQALKLKGEAAAAAGPVQNSGTHASFSASADGKLVYAPRGVVGQQLVWLDRSGKRVAQLGEEGEFTRLFLSPDRKSLAVSMSDPLSHNNDIWIVDVVRGRRTRFTFDPAAELDGIWSPDGRSIVFDSNRKGHSDFYRKAANGTGAEELLYADSLEKRASSLSPDGRFLLYQTLNDPQTGYDIWILPNPLGPAGESKPYPFLRTPSAERWGQFSPNGKWVAYQSDESGRFEIYVAPFPGPGGKRQISTGGGEYPHWRGDGKEIFYISLSGELTAAEVTEQGGTIDAGRIVTLFGGLETGNGGYPYGVSVDGQRFVVIAPPEHADTAPLALVQNWTAMLKK